jgi:hypothetical protein
MQQENNPIQVELSDIWLELLGQPAQAPLTDEIPNATSGERLPMIESDPWSHLVSAQGTEILDLQRLSLSMSDSEVEQLLQRLQEQDDPK